MATLKVMLHPNGQIIRLAGDIHLGGFIEDASLEEAMLQEKKFLVDIEEPLSNFLGKNLQASECFVVEKIIGDFKPSFDLLQNALSQGGIAAIPLITRINLLGNPKIDLSVKSIATHIDKYTLQPRIEIVPYDIRSKYSRLCEMSFPGTQQEYAIFCKTLTAHTKLFEDDIKKEIDSTNKCNPCFSDFITRKGSVLIKELKDPLKLADFFAYTFADFGYLTFIAQNIHMNITLYLGVIHCHNLAQDLEKIGYKTIFERGIYDEESLRENNILCPRSKAEYQEFFTVNFDTSANGTA